MARNVVRRGLSETSTGSRLENGDAVDRAPIEGGTSGSPPDPNPPIARIHGIDDIAPAREDLREVTGPVPVARRYLVTGGPESVMYDGQRVRMHKDKIVSDSSVDVDLLRRQGVEMRELVEGG